MKNAKKIIGSFIDKTSVSVMGSIDSKGFPHAKAMRLRKREGIKTLFFSTDASSEATKHYVKNPKACVYFFSEDKGVLLKGTMKVLKDNASKKRIWRRGDEIFYAKGVADPDYCVLKFTARSGRYYSNYESEDFKVI